MQKILAFVLVALTATAMTAHAGSTRSANYALATTPVVSFSLTGFDPVGSGEVNVGGVTFQADGFTPSHVSVLDASGTAVEFSACQDTDFSGVCGDSAGEPQVVGCGEADLTGFDTTTPVNVFVQIVADPTGGCTGTGSSGVVTLDSI